MNRFRLLFLAGPAAVLLLAGSPTARAAESYDNCKGFIAALPAVITTQGTWCLNKDLATGAASGAAITVQTNNVIIDCNGFKLGNLSAGTATQTIGIRAVARSNVTVRGCNVRGFRRGVSLEGSGGGHVVEGNRFEAATIWGVFLEGGDSIVRGNHIVDTGLSTEAEGVPACGIEAHGATDIVGNTVAGVRSTGVHGATGIALIDGPGSVVRDNVVREIDNVFSETVAIKFLTADATARGNVLTSDGANGTYGVVCGDTGVAVRDNSIAGFETNMTGCTVTLDNLSF